jgi:hypothetical protein
VPNFAAFSSKNCFFDAKIFIIIFG